MTCPMGAGYQVFGSACCLCGDGGVWVGVPNWGEFLHVCFQMWCVWVVSNVLSVSPVSGVTGVREKGGAGEGWES